MVVIDFYFDYFSLLVEVGSLYNEELTDIKTKLTYIAVLLYIFDNERSLKDKLLITVDVFGEVILGFVDELDLQYQCKLINIFTKLFIISLIE